MARLRRGSPAWRLARAAYRPVSWAIGSAYGRLQRGFRAPGIVIGGASRSGTTLLQAVLGAHPSVHLIDHETYALCPSLDPDDFDDPDSFQLYRLWTPIALSGRRSGATRWCEKTPRNILFGRAILDHFGDAVRVVHIVRDGRDVVTSRHPRRPDSYYWSPEGWVEAVRAGLAIDDDERVHRLRYEDLVSDFEPTVRRLVAFLEEPFAEELLNWPRHTVLRRHSAWFGEVREVHARSVERWRDQVHARRVAEFLATPGAPELLERLGYPR